MIAAALRPLWTVISENGDYILSVSFCLHFTLCSVISPTLLVNISHKILSPFPAPPTSDVVKSETKLIYCVKSCLQGPVDTTVHEHRPLGMHVVSCSEYPGVNKTSQFGSKSSCDPLGLTLNSFPL